MVSRYHLNLVALIVINTIGLIVSKDEPKLTPGPAIIKHEIGKHAALICSLKEGIQPIQYEWFKDGVEIQRSSTHSIFATGLLSSLAIETLKLDDAGNYSCKASNNYGSDILATQLIVEGPPQWMHKPSDIQADSNREMIIRCEGTGYPIPEVIWEKQDGSSWRNLFDIHTSFRKITESEIRADELKKDDEGIYSCKLKNGIEPSIKTEFKLKLSAFEVVISSFNQLFNDDTFDAEEFLGPSMDKGDIARTLQALDNREIRALLSIFFNLSSYNRFCKKWTPLYYNTLGLADEIHGALQKEWLIFAQDLCNLLSLPHFRALIWTCDEIANERYKPSLPEDYERSSWTTSTNELLDDMSSIKIVRVIKDQEPLGATIKFDDVTGDIIIARIMHGGAAYRSGLISVGDCIQEVNGVSLKGRSFQEIVNLLENECRSHMISFKLVPGDYNLGKNLVNESRIRMKALFDYNPEDDPYHPCPEAGISFRKGDILHIVSLEQNDWWQARHEATTNDDDCYDSFHFISTRAGLIPSKQLQEKRIAASRDHRENGKKGRFRTYGDNRSYASKLKRGLKYRKVKKIMYKVKDSDELDREDIATYIEVMLIKPQNGEYRPIVILAPHPIDSNKIIEMLMACEPLHFGRPVPHTTRAPFHWERDGYDYNFVNKEWFVEEMRKFRFVEYGQFNNNCYGVHIDSILAIIESGRVCLLNPNPKSLKILYTAAIKPFIVFLRPSFHVTFHSPSSLIPLCINSEKLPVKAGDLKQMAMTSIKMEYLYSHYFDRVLMIENQDRLMQSLLDIIKMISVEEQWVPADWITN